MSSESKPFLSNRDRKDEDIENPWGKQSPRISWRLILVHLALISSYSFVFIFMVQYPKVSTAVHPISNLKINYVPVTPPDLPTSPYAGPPSDLVEQSWHELLKNMNLRVTGEELQRSGQTSIPLPEGGGYMAWIGAHHQLHCIKMLRKWSYREHYYPNLTAQEKEHWDIHSDHCFDILRSAAMCHGDTTLTTFGWASIERPQPHTRPTEYRCVDWDVLMESISSRVVDRNEIEALVNPNLVS